jgi:ABC-type nitrate/sulfonate/bicarbonate transport system substrate-binding protein
MDWQKHITRRVMEGAGEHMGVQLEFLLQRLEAYPEALPAIAEAVQDMAQWSQEQADAIHAELARREAQKRLAEIVNLPQK